MRPSTRVLAGIILSCSVALVHASNPVISNGHLFGFVPSDVDANKIQVGIARQVTSLADAVAGCHRGGVRNLVKGDPSDLAACVARVWARYASRTDGLDGVACIAPPIQRIVGDQLTMLIPAFDSILWCDGTASLAPEGFGGGFEPNGNVYRTESAVSKKLVAYGRAISSCVQRAMTRLVAGDPSGLDACLATARTEADSAMRRGHLPRRIAGLEPADCLKGEHDTAVLLSTVEELARIFSTAVFCSSSPSGAFLD